MDLKLENLLISDEGQVKLCDFGFSLYSQTPVSKTIGTPFYMAPEIHLASQNACNGKLADFFSLGVLFFILAFGVPPFH
jgi:serine/threonine protein kinase